MGKLQFAQYQHYKCNRFATFRRGDPSEVNCIHP